MLLIVYVYDHNVPMPEYLKNTHERFLIFSEKKQLPLPVVRIFSPLHVVLTEDARCRIIESTYVHVRNNGDVKVYSILFFLKDTITMIVRWVCLLLIGAFCIWRIKSKIVCVQYCKNFRFAAEAGFFCVCLR